MSSRGRIDYVFLRALCEKYLFFGSKYGRANSFLVLMDAIARTDITTHGLKTPLN